MTGRGDQSPACPIGNPRGRLALALFLLPAPGAASVQQRARHVTQRGAAEKELVGVAPARGVHVHRGRGGLFPGGLGDGWNGDI